jgi:hypothetical protein
VRHMDAIDLKSVESLRANILREIENLRVNEGMKPEQLEVLEKAEDLRNLEKIVEFDLPLEKFLQDIRLNSQVGEPEVNRRQPELFQAGEAR